ncbi:hypothetical protein BDC45DRAFT_573708 [Circinella umbellata]|nr:hypothetical protein BDC45DRAFT_573708 [Circinella umbellata]
MKNRRNIYAASTSSIPFPSASQRQSTVFSINGSNINHANLRRHLDPEEQQPLQDTPPLIRQGAFMFDDSVDPVCRICYGVTEDQENGHFIRPCQCRGSMYVNNHYHLQSSSPPIPSTSSSSSISHHHHSLFPPSPHQEFHDIPDNNNNNNNNLFLLHNNNNNNSGNVHDKCLNSWLTSVNPTTQKCSTCLHEFTFPPTSTLQPNNDQHQQETQYNNSLNTAESSSSSSHLLSPPTLFTLPALSSSTSSSKKQLGTKESFKRMRYGLYTIGILFLLSFGTVSIQCTEIRKIPGTEIDGNSEAPLGRPDHLYLPIVNWECWRSSFLGQAYFSLWSPYFIIYISLCVSILYLLMNRFHQIPSTTR